VTYAHHSLIEGNRKGTLYGLVATVLLAVIFTGSNYSNSIVSNSTSPMSGVSPYFNAPRSSTSTNKGTLGLNGSNERLWLMTRDGPGPSNR
jgi:hypothetical protein